MSGHSPQRACTVCLLVVCAAGSWGCQAKTTSFDIMDYREAGSPDHYFQQFDECYYSFDAQGNVDVVARRKSRSARGPDVLQVVHVETFWVADPGRTLAEETMINATVSYWIVSGPVGASFEGSGFVSFHENMAKTELQAKLELSSLTPHRRLGSAEKLFERAEVSGTMVASRNKAKVVTALNEMRRLFGPMPRYVHPPAGPDL